MKNFLIAIFVVLAVVVVSSLFVVAEGKRAIVIQFGKIQVDDANKVKVFGPGLHIKIPFI